MAVGDLLGDLGVSISGSSVGFSFIRTFFILAFVLAFVGFAFYWYLNRKSYNKVIIKLREISGVVAFAGEEKCREIVLPFTSTKAFQTKNSKIFLPRPSIESGKDRFLFFIRKDGEWMNVGMGNVNEELKQAKLLYDHTDMRMANASLKKLVEKNYKKLNWLKEYAPYIGFGILILMLAIAGYLILGEAGKVASILHANVDSMTQVAESLAKTSSGQCSSGVVYAT